MPTGVTLENIPDAPDQADLLRFYSYQVQLRRTMNDVHSMLYKKTKETGLLSLSLLDILNENLERWRRMLGTWDWDDNNFEAENINDARMRAKYYGAKYIIYRPALLYVLRNPGPDTPSIKYSDSPQTGSNSQYASPMQHGYSPAPNGVHTGDMRPPDRKDAPMDAARVEKCAAHCVRAAIRSTTSFDRVPQRWIITNIFGTAHA